MGLHDYSRLYFDYKEIMNTAPRIPCGIPNFAVQYVCALSGP